MINEGILREWSAAVKNKTDHAQCVFFIAEGDLVPKFNNFLSFHTLGLIIRLNLSTTLSH